MRASELHPEHGGHADGPGRGTAPLGSGSEPLPRLLAKTIDSLGGQSEGGPWSTALSPADRRRLAAAVARRSGPVHLDIGLAADLVAAVLPESLTALVEGPAGRRRLAERIAGTLLDDPVSASRLQTLVVALRQGVAATGSDAAVEGSPP